jgi:hypothetical protein
LGRISRFAFLMMNRYEPRAPLARLRIASITPRVPARRWPLGWLALAGLGLALLGCDREVTVIDPPDFFTYNPDDAWPAICEPGAKPGPSAVPPPPGLDIQACPNPAPPGTTEIQIQFRLEASARSVNLAIVSQDGEILAELITNRAVGADVPVTAVWTLRNVPPGDYRAYFLAGAIESTGDLRVE